MSTEHASRGSTPFQLTDPLGHHQESFRHHPGPNQDSFAVLSGNGDLASLVLQHNARVARLAWEGAPGDCGSGGSGSSSMRQPAPDSSLVGVSDDGGGPFGGPVHIGGAAAGAGGSFSGTAGVGGSFSGTAPAGGVRCSHLAHLVLPSLAFPCSGVSSPATVTTGMVSSPMTGSAVSGWGAQHQHQQQPCLGADKELMDQWEPELPETVMHSSKGFALAAARRSGSGTVQHGRGGTRTGQHCPSLLSMGQDQQADKDEAPALKSDMMGAGMAIYFFPFSCTVSYTVYISCVQFIPRPANDAWQHFS